MPKQDSKTVDIKQVYTATDLDGVLLQQLGAKHEDSKFNALQENAPLVDFLMRLKARMGEREFKCLDMAIERLERLGNYDVISQLDPQSQAIVKTAHRPVVQKVE